MERLIEVPQMSTVLKTQRATSAKSFFGEQTATTKNVDKDNILSIHKGNFNRAGPNTFVFTGVVFRQD